MDEARFTALIGRHLPFYLSLAQGERQPRTAAQRRFLEVVRGEASPLTDHEHAFTRWRQRVLRIGEALDAQATPPTPFPSRQEWSHLKLTLKHRR